MYSENNLFGVPTEIARHIIGYLSALSAKVCLSVSKLFAEIIISVYVSANLEINAYTNSRGILHDNSVCDAAAEYGYITLLKWAIEYGYRPSAYVCKLVAVGGDLETIQWLVAKGCPISQGTCMVACINHRYNILDWLQSNNICKCAGRYHDFM
jgi:hypothetical protein